MMSSQAFAKTQDRNTSTFDQFVGGDGGKEISPHSMYTVWCTMTHL